MNFAVRYPEMVSRLVVVDIAPKKYDTKSSFQPIIKALRSIDLETLASRSEAEHHLSQQKGLSVTPPAPESK